MNRKKAILIILFCMLIPVASADGNAQVSVTASPASVTSGGTSLIQVVVTYERISLTSDLPGSVTTRPLPDATVTLSTTSAGVTFSPSSGITDSQGRFASTLYASPSASGSIPVRAVAEIPGDYYGEGTITVTVQPATTETETQYPDSNQPPVAFITVDTYSGEAPLTVKFDGLGSYDPDGAVVSYAWDFGDGTTGTGYVVSHTYENAGSYSAFLTVTDNEGYKSDPVMVGIIVKDGISTRILEKPPDAKDIIILDDDDNDGILNRFDNCPHTYNPDQKDSEKKIIPSWHGDLPQDNSDGVGDVCDNCPDDFNPFQEDNDKDTVGDACDNCPNKYNRDQSDSDRDKVGDVCDICPDSNDSDDWDDDGIPDGCDNCMYDPNPPTQPGGKQPDSDNDGYGDACDKCPGEPDGIDTDGDTIGDCRDNCPTLKNRDQKNKDHDSVGDACDCDDGFQGPYETDWDCGGPCGTCDPCTIDPLPAKFDWRDWRNADWMTIVQNQGNCGSCWAFSAVGAVEATYNIERSRITNVDLSEQQLIHQVEDWWGYDSDCEGGYDSDALEHIRDNSIMTESCWPYSSFPCLDSDDDCIPWCQWRPPGAPAAIGYRCTGPLPASVSPGCDPQLRFKIKDYIELDHDINQIKRAILCHGPLSATSGYWGHAIVIVGWDDNEENWQTVPLPQWDPEGPNYEYSQPPKYTYNNGSWIVKNSWGWDWNADTDPDDNFLLIEGAGSAKWGYAYIPYSGHPYSDIADSPYYVYGVTHT